MTASRAQPDALDLKLDHESTAPTRYERIRFLLRIPSWIKVEMHEAAERESLSLNAWCVRVLAEHVKLSRGGWRSIAEQDPPRTHGGFIAGPGTMTIDDGDPIPIVGARTTGPPGVAGRRVPRVEPPLTIEPMIQPNTQPIIYTTGSSSSSSGTPWDFIFPDGDIPDLS